MPPMSLEFFQACFDFGVIEGAMLIGTDTAALEQYGARADREDGGYVDDEDDYDSEEEEEEEEGGKPQTGSKRKAPPPKRGRGRPKKAQTGTRTPQTYQLKARCREHEGPIDSEAGAGTIKFKDKNLAAFVGTADLSSIGSGVSFTARKFTDDPRPHQSEWADYSAEQYERERVSRCTSNVYWMRNTHVIVQCTLFGRIDYYINQLTRYQVTASHYQYQHSIHKDDRPSNNIN